MFAPPWHSGLLAAVTATFVTAPFIIGWASGEQSQARLFAVHVFGVLSGNVHAYCKSFLLGMLYSCPLITLACGFVELGGDIGTGGCAITLLPVRATIDSTMNGSEGGSGGLALGSPSNADQRPLAVSSLAVR